MGRRVLERWLRYEGAAPAARGEEMVGGGGNPRSKRARAHALANFETYSANFKKSSAKCNAAGRDTRYDARHRRRAHAGRASIMTCHAPYHLVSSSVARRTRFALRGKPPSPVQCHCTHTHTTDRGADQTVGFCGKRSHICTVIC